MERLLVAAGEARRRLCQALPGGTRPTARRIGGRAPVRPSFPARPRLRASPRAAHRGVGRVQPQTRPEEPPAGSSRSPPALRPSAAVATARDPAARGLGARRIQPGGPGSLPEGPTAPGLRGSLPAGSAAPSRPEEPRVGAGLTDWSGAHGRGGLPGVSRSARRGRSGGGGEGSRGAAEAPLSVRSRESAAHWALGPWTPVRSSAPFNCARHPASSTELLRKSGRGRLLGVRPPPAPRAGRTSPGSSALPRVPESPEHPGSPRPQPPGRPGPSGATLSLGSLRFWGEGEVKGSLSLLLLLFLLGPVQEYCRSQSSGLIFIFNFFLFEE